MTEVSVYALIEPTTKTLMYVGSTDNLDRRSQKHKRRRPELDFVIVPLEETTTEDRWLCEDEWLKFFLRDNRAALLNVKSTTARNDPLLPRGPHLQETKNKIATTLMGHSVSKIARRKISKAFKGKPLSANHRQAISKSKVGKSHNTGDRRKQSKSLKAWWAIPDNREKMLIARRR